MALFHAVRRFLYILLWLFSAVLFGLNADRLYYTTHLPAGDPLNGGKDFYDGVVVELLVTSGIALFWIPYVFWTIHKRKHRSFLHTFTHSLLGLFVLSVLFIVGAAVATHYWSDLSWCWDSYRACRILTVLVAFAWACAVTTALLFLMELAFAARHKAWKAPMHGYPEERKGWLFSRTAA